MHNVRIFLVRHATSAANLDKTVNATLPDSKVPLAEHGFDQAVAAGVTIREHLLQEPSQRVRMLVSPYLRTRQTADGLERGLFGAEADFSYDRREELALREISFGLFDGIQDEDLPTAFPVEHAHYQKHVDFEGEFYAPMPMGESRAEVADRVKSVFGTILRDATGHNPIRNFIIVSHGVTIRAFIMQWLHLTPEWYEQEANPKNASVTIIESDGFTPYKTSLLFTGFERHERSAQSKREGDG
jgi:2,3-bisphosphoglycerate-dependent phosphoglycerate mutase